MAGLLSNNINNFRYTDDTTMAEREEELNNLLMRVKKGSEKASLKLNIKKPKIMTSGPIISCQIEGENVEAMIHFLSLGSKITADGDCSHEIRRRFLLGKKDITNLDSMLKSNDIILTTNVCIFKAMIFPLVINSCESWTVKKAECQSINAFELWCWGRLLRVPWIVRRSNQSILKEINPEYPLEELMLKLKFQYLGHLM